MGHALRKLRHFDQAAEAIRTALLLVPRRAASRTALAFTLHCQVRQALLVTRCVASATQQHLLDLVTNSHLYASLSYEDVVTRGWALLQGKLMEAIEEYHKALALRPEDSFAAEMLSVALREVVPYPDDMGIALGP
jgi:tetratricopeptide (TPR) repeat protein